MQKGIDGEKRLLSLPTEKWRLVQAMAEADACHSGAGRKNANRQ